MKNASLYKRRIKGLLKNLSKWRPGPQEGNSDLLRLLVTAILQEDASPRQADKALEAVEKEFVDYNELRVALPREVAECIGRDYPNVRTRAEMIKTALKNVFDQFNELSINSLTDLPKRELRRRLEELGLTSFAGACLAMFGFGLPTVPLDDSLLGCLEMNGYVASGARPAEVQGILDKVVQPKDVQAAYQFFRHYVETNAKALGKKRAAEAKARAEAEAKARAEAEAKAKAKAEAAKAKETRKAEREAARKAAARKTLRRRKLRSAGKSADSAIRAGHVGTKSKPQRKVAKSNRNSAGAKGRT
jgi:endonuclease III